MSRQLFRQFFLTLTLITVPAVAKPIRLSKHGFMIEMPPGWKISHKDDVADPTKLSADNPDNAANLTVMLVPIQPKESAAQVLALMDAKRQSLNELKSQQSKVSRQELKKIGADDGVRGQYTQADISQRILLVTDKKQAYLVIGAMRHGQDASLSQTISKSMASFRLMR